MSSQLNHECIRDIMLFIEEHTTYEDTCIWISEIAEGLKEKYDYYCVDYHCRLIDTAGLISAHCYSSNDGEFSGLSWDGHEYLDNIRDQKAWQMLREITKDMSSISVDVNKHLAKEIHLALGKKALTQLIQE